MTAALATLAFLAAGWIAFVAIARTLDEYGQRIASALAGRPMVQTVLPVTALVVRVSPRYPARRPLRALPRPDLRAAA